MKAENEGEQEVRRQEDQPSPNEKTVMTTLAWTMMTGTSTEISKRMDSRKTRRMTSQH